MKLSLVAGVVLGAVALGGCTTSQLIGSAAARISDHYCQNSQERRALIRDVLDGATAPNRVRVECADDAISD